MENSILLDITEDSMNSKIDYQSGEDEADDDNKNDLKVHLPSLSMLDAPANENQQSKEFL